MISVTATAAIMASAACTLPAAVSSHSGPRHDIKFESDAYQMGLLNAGAITVISRPAVPEATSFFATRLSQELGTLGGQVVEKLLAQLEDLRSLEDGWHGPGSCAPDQACLDTACWIVENLLSDRAQQHSPAIGVDHDGEVVLSWNNDQIVGSLSVLSAREFSFFVKNKQRNRWARGTAQSLRPIPSSLMAAIRVG